MSITNYEINRKMENLLEHLHNSKILVTQEWLLQCVQYVRNELQLEESRLILEVQKQWLNSDISTPGIIQRSVFPENVADMAVYNFTCIANFQVNYAVDIGNSSYSQLQKIYKLENENTRVSADTSDETQSQYQPSQGQFVSSWEPKASRMLKLSITDGIQTLEAFEHEKIACLGNEITPGLKIMVHGPLEIKHGKILLKEGHVKILGGNVEHLKEKFSQENVLSQRIGKRVDGPLYPFMKGNTAANKPTKKDSVPPPISSQPQHLSRSMMRTYNDAAFGEDEIDWDDDDFPEDDDFLSLVEAASMPSNRHATDSQEGNKNTQPRSPFRENLALPCSDQTNRQNDATHSNYSVFLDNQSKPKSIVRPLDRNGVEVNKRQKPFAAGAKRSVQTSMSKNLSLKACYFPPSNSNASPSVDNSNSEFNDHLFEDCDDDDKPLVAALRSTQEVNNEPFVYLSEIKRELEKNVDRYLEVSVKAVSTSLVNGIKVVKSNTGQQWLICVVINDGSGAIQAEMRGEIISNVLGEADEYAAAKQNGNQSVLSVIKQRISQLSKNLAALNGIIKLRLNGRDGVASVVEINELSTQNLAKLRRRKRRKV